MRTERERERTAFFYDFDNDKGSLVPPPPHEHNFCSSKDISALERGQALATYSSLSQHPDVNGDKKN